MSASKPPFVVRWRNAVMDDPNPVLTWRALVAAMPLTRHAKLTTGRDCYPGAAACAREMRVSVDTIQRGWAELVEAGWLELKPLPASRRRTQGALKVLRWPQQANDIAADSGHVETTYPPAAAELAADSGPNIAVNREASRTSSARRGHTSGGQRGDGTCGTPWCEGSQGHDGSCFVNT